MSGKLLHLIMPLQVIPWWPSCLFCVSGVHRERNRQRNHGSTRSTRPITVHERTAICKSQQELIIENPGNTEQAFGRWFADELYRSLVSSATQATHHPDVQEKPLREIDHATRSRGDTPIGEFVQSLQYLDRVVSEGLRHSSVGFGAWRLVLSTEWNSLKVSVSTFQLMLFIAILTIGPR